MLVLSRKIGERIFIGPNIVIVVLSSGTGRTKLGIEAPGDTSVLREEIADPDWPRLTFEPRAS